MAALLTVRFLSRHTQDEKLLRVMHSCLFYRWVLQSRLQKAAQISGRFSLAGERAIEIELVVCGREWCVSGTGEANLRTLSAARILAQRTNLCRPWPKSHGHR